ncbi:stage II sporulation protein M [Nanoarchaeota archaeon]
MVLESLVNPKSAQRYYLLLLLVGFLYATIGLFFSYWIFRDQAGLVMVLFVVLAAVPLFYATMKREEEQVINTLKEKDILKSHAKVVRFFMFFFVGLTFGFAFWYVVLPFADSVNIFQIQLKTISSLNQQVTGNVAQVALFSKIFLNNLKVMVFSIVFSFIFGSGAIFILTWNGSVIGAAVGSFINLYLFKIPSQDLLVYFQAIVMSVLRYFVHGIPEITAYFTAGLAGGILSASIIRGRFKENFEKILLDFSDLTIISILLLLIAGLLEVFVTPIFF